MAAWRETPMYRYARCPVHGALVVMRRLRGGWTWSWGCEACMAEATAALDNFVGDRDNRQ